MSSRERSCCFYATGVKEYDLRYADLCVRIVFILGTNICTLQNQNFPISTVICKFGPVSKYRGIWLSVYYKENTWAWSSGNPRHTEAYFFFYLWRETWHNSTYRLVPVWLHFSILIPRFSHVRNFQLEQILESYRMIFKKLNGGELCPSRSSCRENKNTKK
jgi:hypothetical protein